MQIIYTQLYGFKYSNQNTNNLDTVIRFQIFLSNTNNLHTYAFKHTYQIQIICTQLYMVSSIPVKYN